MTRNTPYFAAGIALCGVLLGAAPAAAQLTASGGTFTLATGGVRGNASAYDSRNNTFLAVGGHGSVLARLVRADGSFASEPFQVDEATGYTQYPTVAYSPDADSGRGGYLVTWHQNVGPSENFVHARLVSASGAVLGSQFMFGTERTWWESAPKIAYATGSKVFMVTWRIGAYQIRAVRITNAGQVLDGGAGILVTTFGGERDPSIAYNPNTDQFLIAYSDFLNGSDCSARLVAAGSGALGAIQVLGSSTSVYITDTAFSTGTGKYHVTWYQNPGGTTGRLVNADGTPAGEPTPLSWRFGTYDSLGVAYSSVAQASLLVGQDALTYENGGLLISEAFAPYAPAGLTSVGATNGNFYPEVSASTTEAKWLLTTSRNFGGLLGQFATAPLAGPPPPPPPPPGPSISALNPSHVLPAAVGTSVTWTATASGGSGSLLYRFERWRPGTGWQIVRDYHASSSAVILALSGNQAIRVSVKTSTSSADADAQSNGVYFVAPASRALSLNAAGGGDVFAYHGGNGGGYLLSGNLGTFTEMNYGTGWGTGNAVITADFNGDGMSDLFLYNAGTGQAVRAINGGNGTFNDAEWTSYSWAAGLTVIGGDFNGDGRDDLFTYSKSTGQWTKQLTDPAWVFQPSSGAWSPDWELYPGDFNGDGITDILVYNKNPSSARAGEWQRVLNAPNGGFAAYIQGTIRNWWTEWTVSTGDFDGDGKTDVLLYGTDGRWYKVFFPTSSGPERYTNGQWSLGWTTRVGDFNGDRKDDVFVYNQTSGYWYVCISTGDSWEYYSTMRWAGGFVPTVTDINRDGLADLIVYNPSDGRWFQVISSAIPAQFGYYTGANMETGLQMIASPSGR
jgi:hypothetical protein